MLVGKDFEQVTIFFGGYKSRGLEKNGIHSIENVEQNTSTRTRIISLCI